MTPRIVFAGTPDFSVPCLSALLGADVKLVGVYTQPDRAAGRGKKMAQSPVKQKALEAGLDVFQPAHFKTQSARKSLRDLKPDLMIVVAYGLILPQSVLDIPRLGCVNIHASLLPRWRGAAPIQRAIETGDTQSGVCLMQMNKGLDTGPLIACSSTVLGPDETGGSLHDTLANLGASLMRSKLQSILNQQIKATPQPEQGVSYAHKLTKAEARIDWQMSALSIRNKIRAFNPWPTATTHLNTTQIRLHKAKIFASESNHLPGEVVELGPKGIDIQTGEGILRVTQLQKPGGKSLNARDFLNGFRLETGQRFE